MAPLEPAAETPPPLAVMPLPSVAFPQPLPGACQQQPTLDRQTSEVETSHDLTVMAATAAAATSGLFAEMHWSIVRACDHAPLRRLQAEWWQCCTSAKAGVRAAWSKLKTRELSAKASEQRDVVDVGLASEELRERTVAELRVQLLAMGVDAASQLHVSGVKLVRSPPGAGRQMLHLDVPSKARVHSQRGDAGTPKAQQCYSCILHLHPGEAQSTWVPALPAAQMQPLFDTKGAAWREHAQHLCHVDHFRSHLMQAGDLMVFRGDVPHYGPANESSSEWRWVLFVMFSPVPGPNQDSEQEFLDCPTV